jgi:hypothetical protein
MIVTVLAKKPIVGSRTITHVDVISQSRHRVCCAAKGGPSGGDCRVGWQRGLRHYHSELCGGQILARGRQNPILAKDSCRNGGNTMKERFGFLLVCLAASVLLAGCATPLEHNLPPAERLLGPGPGVTGPGPGVMPPMMPVGHNAMFASGMPMSPGASAVQILFRRPEGMQVRWDVMGEGTFDSTPLIVPGRQNFGMQGIYRLKLTNIVGREGVELYPTLEIGPTTPRTEAYLAHNAIPIQFTEEDFDQVLSGNFVTKVIYLPDPVFQEMALANVETLVSTRLDPGMDPITEADRRGAILAVLRLGNKDIELPGSNGGVASSIPGNAGLNDMAGHPMGMGFGGPAPMGPTGLMPSHVAGVTAPTWGMPITGTPIGLPGPPHIPLGGPAGLQQHTIRNHTRVHMPEPTRHVHMNVRQQPGFSYPTPPNRLHITEQSIQPALPYNQPQIHRHEQVQ